MSTFTEEYLYHHGFEDGGSDTPVREFCVAIEGHLDATADETNAKKIIVGDHKTIAGDVATSINVQRIHYSVGGFTSMMLEYDGDATHDSKTLAHLGAITAEGDIDYRKFGGHIGYGDISLTTQGGSAADTYSIKIYFRVK